MPIIADTHLHLYPCYAAGAALAGLADRLGTLAAAAGVPAAARVGVLVDRAGQSGLADLAAAAPRLADAGLRLAPAAEPGALRLTTAAGADLHLLAGRQIVTAERIEVLALAASLPVPDGLPAAEVLARIRAAGGVPVLSWAPGKWWFARGRLVAGLLAQGAPGTLLLGDTTLRPLGWGGPELLRAARRRGIGIVAGSDPLPVAGDECQMGRYTTVWPAADFDPGRPVGSLRSALADASAARATGARNGPLAAARRLWRNARRR